MKGTVRNTITGKVLYSIEGQWDAAFTIKDCREGSNGAIRPFVDVRFIIILDRFIKRRFIGMCILMVCTTKHYISTLTLSWCISARRLLVYYSLFTLSLSLSLSQVRTLAVTPKWTLPIEGQVRHKIGCLEVFIKGFIWDYVSLCVGCV